MHADMHTQNTAPHSERPVHGGERKKNSEACPKGTVKADLVADFTRKFLEAINRKWLSKSRWSMLTAGTTQEIAERLNGCKKKYSSA